VEGCALAQTSGANTAMHNRIAARNRHDLVKPTDENGMLLLFVDGIGSCSVKKSRLFFLF
jgi:hypothetical protein